MLSMAPARDQHFVALVFTSGVLFGLAPFFLPFALSRRLGLVLVILWLPLACWLPWHLTQRAKLSMFSFADLADDAAAGSEIRKHLGVRGIKTVGTLALLASSRRDSSILCWRVGRNVCQRSAFVIPNSQ